MPKEKAWYVWHENSGGGVGCFRVYARSAPPKPSEWSKPLITAYTSKRAAVTGALYVAAAMAERSCPVQVNIQGKP